MSERTGQSGFSAVELTIVLLIVLLVAGIAVPNIATAMANARLRIAASNLSGVLQNARLAAVKNNATYTVKFHVGSLHGAYVDLNKNGSYDPTEPMVQFGGTVVQSSAPDGTGGSPTPLDGASGPLGWTGTSGDVSFNARGLPCDVTATPCGTNVGYVFYLSDSRATGKAWAAVSVTAAGRIKTWMWDGSNWID